MATKKYVSLDKLRLYDEKIKGVITAGDAAALDAAKAYADGLATNYDVAGAAATVQGKLDTEVARAKAAEEANAAAAKKAQDEVDALEIVVQNIQENAYDDTEVRGLISGLDTNKADKTQVATDIAAAVKVEEDARKEAVTGVQNAVDTLSGTHATDKTALEAAIALKADQTALDGVSAVANAAATKTALEAEVNRATGEEARIEGLVTAESARAAGVEAGLDERLVEVETFFKTTEGETLDAALDTLVEIQKYITDEGSAADQMVLDIAANAKAIEDMDAAYKAADNTLQGNIDTLAGTVATKAAQADLEALAERVETAEGDIDANADAIAALEAKFGEGEGSVADMIADAIAVETGARNAAIAEVQADADKGIADAAAALAAAQAADAKAQTAQNEVDALELVVAGKAAASDVTALSGRVTTVEGKVTTAEGKITTLEGEMDAVEAKASANETAIGTLNTTVAGKADKTALQNEIDRATAAETALGARIDEFVECSETDINEMFTA